MLIKCGILGFWTIVIFGISDHHLIRPIMKAALFSIVTLTIAMISLAEAQVQYHLANLDPEFPSTLDMALHQGTDTVLLLPR